MSETWEKLPALDGRANPCACCPPIPAKFDAEGVVGVGFGMAHLERDARLVEDGEHRLFGENPLTGAECESLAAADPDHDWRIVMHGPLHGETYQRHGPNEWNLVEKIDGFA